VYETVDRVVEAGHDPRRFATDLLERLRDLVVLDAVPDANAKGLIDCPPDQIERMTDQAARLGTATLSRMADIVHTGLIEMRGTTSPRLLLELVSARMLLPSASADGGAVLQRLERMERRLSAAGDPVEAPSPRPERAPTRPSGGRAEESSGSRPDRAGSAEPARAGSAPAESARAGSGPAGSRAAGSRAAESRAAESGPAGSRASGSRAADSRTAESGPAGSRTAGSRAAGSGAAESRTAESRTAESGTGGSRAADPGSGEAPAESRPSEFRPAGEATPPTERVHTPVGQLDAAAVRRIWPEVLDSVKRRRRTAHALLMNVSVQSVDHGVLTLTISSVPLSRLLAQDANTDVVRSAIKDVLGVDWRINVVVDGGGPGGGGQAGPAGRDATPPPDDDPRDDEPSPPTAGAAPARVDPEEAAISLLQSTLGAKRMDG
jgi:DNA polymerase III subunit gamma/tau